MEPERQSVSVLLLGLISSAGEQQQGRQPGDHLHLGLRRLRAQPQLASRPGVLRRRRHHDRDLLVFFSAGGNVRGGCLWLVVEPQLELAGEGGDGYRRGERRSRRLVRVAAAGVRGEPLCAHVLVVAPRREVEPALAEALPRGLRHDGHDPAQTVGSAHEQRRQRLQRQAVRLGGPRHLELRPEVHLHHEPAGAGAGTGPGLNHQRVDVLVLAGRVGGGLLPPRRAHRRVVPERAEPVRHGAADVRLLPPAAGAVAALAAALRDPRRVRQEVPLRRARALHQALREGTGRGTK